jgi:hypothetical protein
MNTVWDKWRAFVMAVGGHAIVLALLCLDWSRASALRASSDVNKGAVPAVEATLVTAPLSSEIVSVTSPPAPSATPPLPTNMQQRPIMRDTPRHEVSQSSNAQIADPPPPPGLNDVRSQAESDQQVAPPEVTASPVADATQQTTEEADDPYAEMRRQRAEVERQHLVDEMNLQRMQDQQTVIASSNLPQVPPAPPNPFVESREAAYWSTRLQPSAITPDLNGWTFSSGLPSTRCPFTGFQSVNDGRIAAAWIDCLMNPARAAQRTKQPG